MFKLVKWAFRLGQQTERYRIENILREQRRNIQFQEFGSNNDPSREKIVQATARAVDGIVGRIIDPRREYKPGTSLLYPKWDNDNEN